MEPLTITSSLLITSAKTFLSRSQDWRFSNVLGCKNVFHFTVLTRCGVLGSGRRPESQDDTTALFATLLNRKHSIGRYIYELGYCAHIAGLREWLFSSYIYQQIILMGQFNPKSKIFFFILLLYSALNVVLTAPNTFGKLNTCRNYFLTYWNYFLNCLQIWLIPPKLSQVKSILFV